MTRTYEAGIKSGLIKAAEVCKNYDVSVWRHCDTSSHAADMVSSTLFSEISLLIKKENELKNLDKEDLNILIKSFVENKEDLENKLEWFADSVITLWRDKNKI